MSLLIFVFFAWSLYCAASCHYSNRNDYAILYLIVCFLAVIAGVINEAVDRGVH